jgi:hypothetical protein
MSDLLTPEQLKTRAYYQQNKQRFLENAKRYRLEHREEARQYQAQYFQRYKKTAKYREMQEKRAEQRQRYAQERARLRAEERAKEIEEERLRQPLPLVIEKPPTTPVEPPLPPDRFVVKFL